MADKYGSLYNRIVSYQITAVCREPLHVGGNSARSGGVLVYPVKRVPFIQAAGIAGAMRDYLAGDFKRKKEQVLSLQEQMEEFMFLGLRMRDGVDERRFEELFGKKLREVYAEPVQKYLKLGLLEEIRDLQKGSTRLTLTARGIDVSNTVMADFLFD